MLTLPIKKKKGSFLIAIYNCVDYIKYLEMIDGYLFEYKGYELGLYKHRYKKYKPYLVIDLKTGRMIVSLSKLKDLELVLDLMFDKFINLTKTEEYQYFIEERNKLVIYAKEENRSLYHWKNINEFGGLEK